MAASNPLRPALADESIGAVVRLLADFRGVTRQQMADALGVNKATINRRLAGQLHFWAHDIKALSRLLNAQPEVFFREPTEVAEMLSKLRGSNIRYTPLSAVELAEGQMELALIDPTDLRSVQ